MSEPKQSTDAPEIERQQTDRLIEAVESLADAIALLASAIAAHSPQDEADEEPVGYYLDGRRIE